MAKSFEKIEFVCSQYGIENYTINFDGYIDVNGDVDLKAARRGSDLYKTTKLPLMFNNVYGDFKCGDIGLTTLEGCPKIIKNSFFSNMNSLSSLEYCPKEIGQDFICSWNNNLTSLEGLEKCNIYGDLSVQGCKNLYTLNGFPINLDGEFKCTHTPIYPIYKHYIQSKTNIKFFNELSVIYYNGNGEWNLNYNRLVNYIKEFTNNVPIPNKKGLETLLNKNVIKVLKFKTNSIKYIIV